LLPKRLLSLISHVPCSTSTARTAAVRKSPSRQRIFFRVQMSVDLGARSLVGGVDCNDPEKSPF
jgi:hypothetical protein